MVLMRVLPLVGLLITIAAASSSAIGRAGDEQPASIGEIVPDLEFKDTRYLLRSLNELSAKKAYVVVFLNGSCPVAKQYLPELVRLEKEFRGKGAAFLALNASGLDSISDMATQAVEVGAEFPFGKDSDGRCAQALGISRTPGVAVLDADRRLLYRGRIDDHYRVGGGKPAAARSDLREALEAVLAGREVAVKETAVAGCLITPEVIPRPSRPVTFHEQVEPIVQKHCQDCHRPGAEAPFALLSYRDVASQAEMVSEVVADRRMPPWHGSRRHGEIANVRGLSDGDRETILQWAGGGRLKGDTANRPPAREFPKAKWAIGEPDGTTTTPFAHDIPAEGVVDYKFTVLPYVFLADTWLQKIEILPDNPAVVHHCNMAFVTTGEAFKPENFITGRVPGGDPMILDEGTAFLVPKGSLLALEIHYTTTGKPERSRISVGWRYPRTPVHKRLYHKQVYTNRIQIPPGAPSHPITARRTLEFDATGVGLFSHMHVRGKDMTFRAIDASGGVDTLLIVPNYHFDWQQSYRWAPGTKHFAKGTTFEVLAHYDNSAFNPYNPDPTATVTNGRQTSHEMMYGFYFFTRDDEDLKLTIDPATGRAERDPPLNDGSRAKL
jgi:thiol-disulfide isomerase/thioredoxin